MIRFRVKAGQRWRDRRLGSIYRLVGPVPGKPGRWKTLRHDHEGWTTEEDLRRHYELLLPGGEIQ